MKLTFQEHFASAVQTFVSLFLIDFGTSLLSVQISWSWAFWAALLIAVVRSAVKEVFARYAPVALGGKQV